VHRRDLLKTSATFGCASSRPTRRGACLTTFLVVVGAASHSAVAQIAERPARVEVVIPKAPTPVTVDTQRVLVYELHVTNFGTGPLVLRQLDIMDAASPHVPLASYRDSALGRVVVPAGSMMDMGGASSTRLDPGVRAIVFVWLPIEPSRGTRDVLRHRLFFDIGDSATMRRDRGTQSVIDNIMVEVSRRPAPVLPAPLRGGQWLAGSAPSNTSDHRRSLAAIDGHVRIAQRFAIDWNMVGPNGDTHHGDEHKNESYWGFGQPVYSVASGEVVAAVDSIADHPPHSAPPVVTLASITGNYVTVRIGPDRYATYAHLEHGGIRVHVGQSVRAGEVIALLGCTGQTTAPHLHFQLTDGPSVLDSEGIPYTLESYTDLGSGQDFEEDKHPSIPRRRAMPGENEVVALP
jgi:murein DD-endopeptidase